ncbi:hypothetical protein PsorP6_008166 [Peronosclerospora sorghi]|uniref:Uncharacterized protein n=1 Tax=Peronosclerospora sorghi TaxID=230839 RepID=A0ACC0WAF3_9STRA|nr:hypothetical protein PsorP6_008166 [Peronosclerospora sorghi]
MALVNRSMVLKRSAAVVGIEEFIDKRKERLVIHGCIKMKAEDFVVHEISAAGEVVKLGDKIDRLPSEEERNAVLKKLEGAHQKEKKERFEFDDPEGGWRSALIQQIGTKGFQGVESVAKGLRNDFFVISPTELRERVYLQVCIQNCFPGLDCKIHEQDLVSLEEDAVQQIQVILDPVYKKFREGGVGQVNCDRLLTFLRKGAGDPMALNGTNDSKPCTSKRLILNLCKGLELEHEDTKKARTALHRLVAKHSSSFKSKTEKRNGKQCVVVYFLPKNIKKRKRHHRTVYLQFVLQKKNVEHFLAFEKLARLLRCSLSAFSYAGTKDKAALTFQHVVVCGVDPKELLKVNGMEPGIRVGNLSYVETPLTLGGGYGNKFLISVRDLTVNTTQLPAETLRSTLELTLKNIQHQGFVNYFGFQRVGHPTGTVRPHHIGEKMIASKWKEALKLILEVQDVDTMDTMKAKRLYLDSGDIDAALKLMPLNMVVERHVLQGLKRFGSNAFEQAVQTLPFSRRLMYLHAYQSYLFNRVASFRLRYYEKKVVQGDLIRYDTGKDKAVKAVTADEANEMNESSENAIRHVLLPLVGPNIVLPGNATNDAYVKVWSCHQGISPLFIVAV